MFKKLLLGSLVGVPVGVYFYHGFNNTYPVQETKLPPQNLLYIQHVGTYNKIQDTFDIIGKDFKEFRNSGQELPGSNVVGIYYDDPRQVPDETRHRAVIGVLFDPSGRDVAKSFLQNRPQYSYKELPELSVAGTKVPFKSVLTYLWVFYKIHPQVRDYAKNKKLVQDEARAPLFELYRIKGENVVDVETYVPYGAGSESVELARIPEAPKK